MYAAQTASTAIKWAGTFGGSALVALGAFFAFWSSTRRVSSELTVQSEPFLGSTIYNT